MSITAMVWALQQRTGSPSTKLVLLKLADNANDTGTCWPSVHHIVTHTELSERAVRSQIKTLEELGLLKIERRYVEGVQIPNVYHLQLHQNVGVVHDMQGGTAGGAPPVVQEVHPEPSKGNQESNLSSLREEPATPKRKSRLSLPEDFPDEPSRIWAETHWLGKGRADLCTLVDEEAAKFRDYHSSNPKGSADWPASWRTWCKNAMNFSKANRNGNGKLTGHQAFAAAAFSIARESDPRRFDIDDADTT